MKLLKLLVLAAGCTILGQPALASSPCPSASEGAQLPAPTLDQKIWVATRIYDTVGKYFAHWEGLPIDYDFDRQYKSYITEAVASKTRLEFDLATMKLFGSLANGHTRFFDTRLMCAPKLPFLAQRLQGKWVVVRSAQKGLEPGDTIMAIDNVPFGQWVDTKLPYVRGSNLTGSESTLFYRALVWPVRFTLKTQDGHEVRIDRDNPATEPPRGLPTPPGKTRVSMPDGHILRIEIPSFSKPEYERSAVDAIRAHASVPVLLLDLRGNGGGATPMDLVHALLEHPIRDMLDATPLRIGTIEAWQKAGMTDYDALSHAMLRTGGQMIQPDNPIFHGRVYLLTDRYCASACEDFVTYMRIAHRAKILGETTEGTTGQPYRVDFPDLGMNLIVSTRREYFPDFTPFEGMGVKPDVEIPVTPEMLKGGQDTVLTQAETIIRNDLH